MRKCTDIYEAEPMVFTSPGFIVRVWRPILTDEERARRMKRIAYSAAELIKDQMREHKHIQVMKND